MKIGFANHGRLAFAVDAGTVSGLGTYVKTKVERLGDLLLIPSVGFRLRMKRFLTHPQVITVFLTLATCYLVTLVFYTVSTLEWTFDTVEWIVRQIKHLADELRLFFYLLTISQVLGFGIRAFGRFGNRALMLGWYEQLRTANVQT